MKTKRMKIKKVRSNDRKYYFFTITGAPDCVKKAEEVVCAQKFSLCIDYCDKVDNDDGTVSAEFVTHKSDARKVGYFFKEEFS